MVESSESRWLTSAPEKVSLSDFLGLSFNVYPLDCGRVNENLDVTTMTYYLRQCNIHDSYLGPRQFLFNAIAKMLIL